MKSVLLLALITISLVVTPIAIADGQVSDSDLIALSNDELTFYGNETTPQLTSQIFIVGLAQNVQVNLFTGQLYDNSSQNKISIREIPSFSVSTNQQKQIDIIIVTSGAEPATYYGSIIVTAVNADNNTTKNIGVTVTIAEQAPPFIKLLLSYAYQVIILIVVLILLASALLLSRRGELAWAIVVTFGALILWFSSMIVAVFKPDIVSAIFTAIIVPLAAFIIDRVKKESDDKTTQIKTSTEVQTEAIKDDVNWVRDVMGEIATHFASFEPKFEGMSDIPRSPEILYPEKGVLERPIWDKSCKQGAVSDLPTLHLEKYYDYIELYNRYYKAAMMLTRGKTVKEFAELEKTLFFVKFEAFRKRYAQLETVLFVYLSYLIGLFGKTRLSPLKVEYPRVTRVLLFKLLEYEILTVGDYVTDKDLENALAKKQEIRKYKIDSFEEDWDKEIEDEKNDLSIKFDNYEKRQQEFQKWYNDHLKIWGATAYKRIKDDVPKGEYDRLKVWLFRKKIKNWRLSASDLDRLLKDIYYKDDIPRFYYRAGEDFRNKFRQLLQSIKDLDPLPEGFVKKERIPDVLKQFDVHKGLLDELERIGKLKEKQVIGDEEYKSIKKEILEKFKS